MKPGFKYSATVRNVVDGDTVDLIIDVGFNIQIKERVRLWGIDTPETRTRNKAEKAAGLRAKEFVSRALWPVNPVLVNTHKGKGKFGRYLAVIYYIPEGKKRWRNLNRELVRLGYAKEYMI